MKKTASKVVHNRSELLFFHYCQPAENQPKSQILFHKSGSLRDFYKMTLVAAAVCKLVIEFANIRNNFKQFNLFRSVCHYNASNREIPVRISGFGMHLPLGAIHKRSPFDCFYPSLFRYKLKFRRANWLISPWVLLVKGPEA